MAVKKTYYCKKRRTYGSRSLSLGKVIAAVLAAAIVITSGIILIPRLVHHCDSCDKLFLGTGYYANGGKLIPIVWGCDDEDSAFHFLTNDAQDLEMGVGNTYIAIVTPESPVTWEATGEI